MEPRSISEETDDKIDVFFTLCEKYLSKDIAELVKTQHCLAHNQDKHRGLAYKKFFLHLYYTSPNCYRILGNLINLPKAETLKKIDIPFSTEMNGQLIEILKCKVDHMTDADKECCVIIGTMTLTRNVYYDISHDQIYGYHEVDGEQIKSKLANFALVLIVRGIFSKWMQPIGFAFSSQCTVNILQYRKFLSTWAEKNIQALMDIGLKVRAFVTDQKSDYAYKPIPKRTDTPFFNVRNQLIYYIYDAPKLMMYIRNNLLKFHIHYGENYLAKYSDILSFYRLQQKKDINSRFAQKLTDSHVTPNESEKLVTRYAVELLSKSVAFGMSTYVDFSLLKKSAGETMALVQILNDLFDILNSSKMQNEYKYKNAFTGEHFQTEYLRKCMHLFNFMEFSSPLFGVKMKNQSLADGFVITIRSILLLFADLKKAGYNHLFTRRLNQDIVEEFFGEIRFESGKEEPTCREFIAAFRKLCFRNILFLLPKRGDRKDDMKKFLLRLTELLNLKADCRKPAIYPLRDISRADYKDIEIPNEHALMYVVGWLLGKCIEKHNNCKHLMRYVDLNSNFFQQKARTRFSKYIEHVVTVKADLPAVPPDDFFNYVWKMEAVFVGIFEKQHKTAGVGKAIYDKIQGIDFINPMPCPCFPKEYLQKLFVRMRIFIRLKTCSVTMLGHKSTKCNAPVNLT